VISPLLRWEPEQEGDGDMHIGDFARKVLISVVMALMMLHPLSCMSGAIFPNIMSQRRFDMPNAVFNASPPIPLSQRSFDRPNGSIFNTFHPFSPLSWLVAIVVDVDIAVAFAVSVGFTAFISFVALVVHDITSAHAELAPFLMTSLQRLSLPMSSLRVPLLPVPP